MGRYKALYTCLVCKRTMVHGDPVDIEDEMVAAFVKSLGDPSFDLGPNAQSKMPHVLVHKCDHQARNIGACLFAGFVRCDDFEDSNIDSK